MKGQMNVWRGGRKEREDENSGNFERGKEE